MKRVVITGMGVVSSLGNDLNTFWDNIKNGRSGAKLISRFNAEKFKTQFAAQLPDDFSALQYLDRNEIKRNDLYTQYALIAAKQAIEDSGFDISAMSPYDVGVIFGSAQGGMQTFEEQVEEYAAKGEPHFNPFFIPKTLVNMAAGLISIKYGLMGVNFTTVSACASANSAIMDALNYIRWGKAKIIITGGADAPITQASMGGYNALKALSTRNSDPQAASRPFDVERDGFMMGEGAGVLVLEEYEHAVKRGATIYAEVAGAAMTGDAYHITATHPEGKGAIKAMELALMDAGLNHSEVDYLNAHATSTPVGDLSEAKAIYSAFGDSERLSVSATKSMTGHLLGAAGAIEAIISAKAVLNGIVPPTINTHQLDPQIPQGLNIVTAQAQEKPVHVALSNTFGFGGHNSVVVFKKA